MKHGNGSGNVLRQIEKTNTNLEKCISEGFHQYSNSVDSNITLAYKEWCLKNWHKTQATKEYHRRTKI